MNIEDLLQREDFCNYIESFARFVNLNYSEVYDSVIEGNYVGIVVIEGYDRVYNK